MNLVVDVGNTRVKLGVFHHDNLVESYNVTHDALATIVDRIYDRYDIDLGIISSVSDLNSEANEVIESKKNFYQFSSNSKVPFKNTYKTPRTLGLDRLALMAAAYHAYPDKNCLVIDAGTCITYDFLDSQGIYCGGSISPGLEMRFKALSYFTAKLPLLQPEKIDDFIGNDTNSSIQTGVVNGVISEIEDKIQRYQNRFGDLTVVLTGGDTNFLSKQLKNSIFANQNFLLVGLNEILKFNNH